MEKEIEDKIETPELKIIKQKEQDGEVIESFQTESIGYLKTYLKKNNRITVKEYSSIIGKSQKVALRLLNSYEKEKKLKKRREEKGRFVFYC